jgi:hypothetical protein
MKKLEISNPDLLKNWDHADLIDALDRAKEKTTELNPTSGEFKMWLTRQLDYAAELDRRYKLNK